MSHKARVVHAMAVVVRQLTKRKNEDNEENKKVVKKKKRTMWVKECREDRYYNYNETENDIPYKFMEVLGIDDAAFNSIMEKVSHKIQKTDSCMRQAIPAKLKLQVFLEYVSTGCTITSLDGLFHVSTSSISKFIPEVAEAICETFGEFIQTPAGDNEWKTIADGFKQYFGAENCVGVIQAKTFYSKHWIRFSKDTAIYFWFAADTRHSLVCIDIGTCMKDGLEFPHSNLAKSLQNNSIGIPEEYYFIGPIGVRLDKYIMTPFIGQGVECLMSNGEEIYNRKLAQISRTADDTYNLLRSRFKMYDNPPILAPESVVKLLKSTFALHNWMQRIVKTEFCNSEEVADVQLPGVSQAPGMFNLISSYQEDGCNEEAVRRRYELAGQFRDESSEQAISDGWSRS